MLRLLLNRETTIQGGHLLGCLPLGQLAQPLVPCPYKSVDDFQEQLSSSGIEDEDWSINRLGGQIAL